ncbi:MAG: YfiR family protein [Gemmatimonadales bacterium]
MHATDIVGGIESYEAAPRLSRKVFTLIGLLAGLLSGPAVSPAAAQTGMDARAVMAAFVHRFPQFVDWPESALEGRDRFEICVAADSDFLRRLQDLVADSEFEGRSVTVRAVGTRDLAGCHVLFVSAAEDNRVGSFIQAVAGLPVLTVSDAPGFLDESGMIELRVIDRRIRFAVNAAAASQAGLRSSAQLLELALEVRGGGE